MPTTDACPDGEPAAAALPQQTKQQLLEAIGQETYFHDMDLGEARTGSRASAADQPPNYHLFPVFEFLADMDLSQARCLDIDTGDGMTAFVMAEMGANRVDATCRHDLKRFRLVHASKPYVTIRYHPGTPLRDIEARFSQGAFDLIRMSAHHLTSPLDALFLARNLLREQGYLVLEAAIRESDEPTVVLNAEVDDPVYKTPSIWIFSEAALVGLARLACFSVVSTTHLTGTALAGETHDKRIALLCQAVKPSGVAGRTERLARLHKEAGSVGCIDFNHLEADRRAPARIRYHGATGPRRRNIWDRVPDIPLQPAWTDPRPERDTSFAWGTNDRFMQLLAELPHEHWSAKDVSLLGAKYPGESFPEGMAWSLKQFGNLFCLSHLKRWDCGTVLEIGPGFNHYFSNHLPAHVAYWSIDDSGFYDAQLIALANAKRRGRKVEGLIGSGNPALPDNHFDAVFSVSCLEHIPVEGIDAAARDMARILKPGGWCLHSLDLGLTMSWLARKWLTALEQAGFLIDPESVRLDEAAATEAGKEVFLEPLSLIQRFHVRYREKPWLEAPITTPNRFGTVLVAARKKPA